MIDRTSERLVKKYVTLGFLIIAVAIPFTIFQTRQNQDNRSSAAAADKLETENGILSSSGTNIQSDSSASGGKFIVFSSNMGCSQTPLNTSTAGSDGGFAWYVEGSFGTTPDNSSNSTQSKLRLFENGTEIGPAHSIHAEIRNIGQGKFSHWSSPDGSGESIRFSAKDNSDPRTNGKNYTYCAGTSSSHTTNTPTPTTTSTSKNIIGPQPVASTPLSSGTIFASPNGTGSTCSQASPCNLITATNNANPGDVVFLRGGTYLITQNVYFSKKATQTSQITFESYPGEWAVFDGSSLAAGTQIYIRITGSYYKLRKFEIKNMPMQGIWIGGNYNILEGLDVHHNKLSGIHIFSPYESFPYGQYGSYNQIINSKAHDNSDAGLGGSGQEFNRGNNADGISVSSGEGNIIKNVILERNSDDGIDLWRSTNSHVSNSISTGNGIDEGNGVGFKAGGAAPSSGTIIENSISYNNKAGFDSNSGKNLKFNKVTVWNNSGHGIYTDTGTTVSNSISVNANPIFGGGGTATNNSWQRSGTPSFISTDPTSTNFLRPTVGSGFEDIGAYAN